MEAKQENIQAIFDQWYHGIRSAQIRHSFAAEQVSENPLKMVLLRA